MRTKPPVQKPDPGILNCRVKISNQKEENPPADFFNVEIYGTIPVQQEKLYAILQISIADITDRFKKPKPVHSSVKQHRQKNSLLFCYRADLGWISKAESTLFGSS